MPVLSIIVPVYNVATYLREGLDSILRQEVQDIEVICVDDCSSDSSPDILKEYQAKDNRIQFIRQSENKGPSATRNIGIKYAKGKYIAFFDPDDKVENNLYAELIHAIEDKKTDLALCGYSTFPTHQIHIPNFKPYHAMQPMDFIQKNPRIEMNNDLCYTWRFVFKRNFLINKKIRYIKNLHVGEDTVFNYECVLQASSIIMIPKALYQYRINNAGSLMRLRYKPYLTNNLQKLVDEKKRLIRKYNIEHYIPITTDLSEKIILRYLPMLFNNLYNNSNQPDKKQGIQQILSMTMIRDSFRIIGFRNIYPSWKEYLFYLAMKFKFTRLVCYEYNKIFTPEKRV